MALMTISTATVVSEPFTGMGRRRPLPSGSPSFIRMTSSCCTLPLSLRTLTGAVRKWKVIFPLIKWFVKYKTKKKFPKDPHYLSDVILEGEDLIFVTKKMSD
jgi:hypothetical protein